MKRNSGFRHARKVGLRSPFECVTSAARRGQAASSDATLTFVTSRLHLPPTRSNTARLNAPCRTKAIVDLYDRRQVSAAAERGSAASKFPTAAESHTHAASAAARHHGWSRHSASSTFPLRPHLRRSTGSGCSSTFASALPHQSHPARGSTFGTKPTTLKLVVKSARLG